MAIRARSAPAITRVHTLHRIRTVVTYVHQLMAAKAVEIDDVAIANHLINTHLSKPTTAHFRDQIGRRARDHLETARYLGLLKRARTDGKFRHVTTMQGNAIASYRFEDECPNDYKEEAVLIDKVCRFKLANTSYLQTGGRYEHFRSRVCLNLLGALRAAEANLSVFQLGYILGEPLLDPFTHPRKLAELVRFVTSRRFGAQYHPTDAQRKTIRRDTNPFLDWCAQLDLVRWVDAEYVELTARGRRVLSVYASMLPLWYCDCGPYASVVAGAFLVANFLKLADEATALPHLLSLATKWRLFKVTVAEALRRAPSSNLAKLLAGPKLADFTPQYDVEPGEASDVSSAVSDLLGQLGFPGLKVSEVLRFLETAGPRLLRPAFRSEATQQARELAKKVPVRVRVRAASIYSQFRSPYEAATYTLFKALETPDFAVHKYQAQLEPLFAGDKRWGRFAKNNPDLLLTNDFFGLLECKSTAEWGQTLTLRKGVVSEITYYDLFCDAVKKLGLRRRCVVLFCYEGSVPTDKRADIEDILRRDFSNVLILTRRALQNALVDVSSKNRLRETIKTGPLRRHVIDVRG